MDQIIERWVAGDAAAGEELYRLYDHRVKEFLIKRGANIVDAEDIAQEAMIAGLEDSRRAALPTGSPSGCSASRATSQPQAAPGIR